MHPILAPGTHLLRRGPADVQAGLDPATAVPLRATSTDPVVPLGLLDPLLGAGLATRDDRAVRTALPAVDPADPWPRHTMAALARRMGDRVTETLAVRAGHQVQVHAFGHPLAADLADDLTELCRRSGLALPGPARPGPAPRRRRTPTPLPVLVGVGEPQRTLVDPWLGQGTPHLVVRLVEGHAVVGPFVVPGSSACLRCVDAHRSAQDLCWPLLVEQYARATSTDRADGIPEPVDPALAALALGWAVRDLATYAEGGMPSTLGSTVRISPALEAIETHTWSRHPDCGCSWA